MRPRLTKVLFVEPPKDYWFVMGEYLPPPYGMLQLAAYLENQIKNVDIQVLDCQAMELDWAKLEKRMESFNPDIVCSSGFATCNAYVTARTLETAKKINSDALTVTGGQHFTVTAQESLEAYPEMDVIVRGEGEQTLTELVKTFDETHGKPKLADVKGISFRHGKLIKNSPPRPLMENLDALPFPGYHFVKDYVHKYNFKMMARPNAGYGMIEASRGCPHRCTFCSQWKHWQGTWRHKSIKRVVDEIESLHNNYGNRLIWLTDDNFGFGKRMEELCNQLIARGFTDDLTTFMQARCDDVVQNKDQLPKLHKAGINYLLLGVESNSKFTLNSFRKGTDPEDSKQAVKLLKENGIFSQATGIVGERKDSAKTIHEMREFMNFLDPDLAIFMILTPYPGTDLFEEAKRNGWIEDWNWANYDMIHAIMPTETLTREEVQQELYRCYRSFFGSFHRRIEGFFSNNQIKRRVYRYTVRQDVLRQLKSLV
jgi:anaerobic magnesium-protoporphyrin IX monomethyl ester cyclase